MNNTRPHFAPFLCANFTHLEYASRILEQAVDALGRLPGIGRKTALRLALHLVRSKPEYNRQLVEAIVKLTDEIKRCRVCHNLSDTECCAICTNPKRDAQLLCVVEDIRDVLAIEATGQFTGRYHVLGGLISPMDGIGPAELEIDSLLARLEPEAIRELIFALGATVEGDSTAFYLFRKLPPSIEIRVTAISRGIGVGDPLEFADELSLGRSIVHRIPYENSLKR